MMNAIPPVEDRPAVLWHWSPSNLCAALAPPGKQIGREIRGGSSLTRGAGRKRLRIEFGFDRFPIEMPGGMAKQWDDDGKAEEERQRSRDQQDGHDQSPERHRHRIPCD